MEMNEVLAKNKLGMLDSIPFFPFHSGPSKLHTHFGIRFSTGVICSAFFLHGLIFMGLDYTNEKNGFGGQI